jgi:hypothetical protein
MSEIVADIALDALRAFGFDGLEEYGRGLRAACNAAPPPFGRAWYGERYRSFASDPSWFANSLVANAAKEGEGATKLWSLAGRIQDLGTADSVRRHAIDESRHARFYLSLLQFSFPETAVDIRDQNLWSLSPGYGMRDRPPTVEPSPEQQVLDELIQMNIGEVRTLIHQLLMQPLIVVHCPREGRRRVDALVDGLGRDERRHIGYTARLIDAAAKKHPKLVRMLMERRLREFNELTLAEVGIPDVGADSFD